ncbi:hypothetical protein MRY82_08155 [bacterium]|nr:hypothetical protein [bacterium]
MKRNKKDIESDIKQNLSEVYGLLKEYFACNSKDKTWAKDSLDFSIDGLEALGSFLKKQRSKIDKTSSQSQNNSHHENITVTEDEDD